MANTETDTKKISSLAEQIMSLAHDDILMHPRFFDMALSQVRRKERLNMGCFATDGQTLFYDPVYVLKCYRENPKYVARVYLHMLLHCIFFHSFQYDKLETDNWDMAADIAVENVIIDMQLPGVTLEQDGDAVRKLKILRGKEGLAEAVLQGYSFPVEAGRTTGNHTGTVEENQRAREGRFKVLYQSKIGCGNTAEESGGDHQRPI